MSISIILTCEHASNHIPKEYKKLFSGQEERLASHLGYDIGALECARFLQEKLQVPFFHGEISRLCVDLNRSVERRAIFSQEIQQLNEEKQSKILEQFYHPYREQVLKAVQDAQEKKSMVLHLSIHSFTPVLDGVKRDADLGILYDTARNPEKRFAHLYRFNFLRNSPFSRVRKNYPYQGSADGLTTALRKKFNRDQYMGIELEINQMHPLGPEEKWKKFQAHLYEALKETCASLEKNK